MYRDFTSNYRGLTAYLQRTYSVLTAFLVRTCATFGPVFNYLPTYL